MQRTLDEVRRDGLKALEERLVQIDGVATRIGNAVVGTSLPRGENVIDGYRRDAIGGLAVNISSSWICACTRRGEDAER